MASDALATWIVEFDASGVQVIDGALEAIKAQIMGVDALMQKVSADGSAGMKAVTKETDKLDKVLNKTFASAKSGADALAQTTTTATAAFGGWTSAIHNTATATANATAAFGGWTAAITQTSQALKAVGPVTVKMEDFATPQMVKAQQAYRAAHVSMEDFFKVTADNTKAAEATTGKFAMGIRAVVGEFKNLAAAAGIVGVAFALLRAGLAGTGEMRLVAFYFTQIGREIASMFAPALHGLIDLLQKTFGWLSQLSGKQQELIGKAVLLTVAIKALNVAFAASPILGIVSAIGMVLTSTERGRGAIVDMFRAITDAVTPAADAISSVVNALSPIISVLATIIDFIANNPIGQFVLTIAATTAAFYLMGQVAVSSFTKATGSAAGMNLALLGTAASANTAAAGVGRLSLALKALTATNPILLALAALGAVVGLFSAFSGGNKGGEGHKRVGAGAGPDEDLEQTWMRLQVAGARTSDPAQRTREGMLAGINRIAENTGRPTPFGSVSLI